MESIIHSGPLVPTRNAAPRYPLPMHWNVSHFSRPLQCLPDETLERTLARHPDVLVTTEQRDQPPLAVHQSLDDLSMQVPEGTGFHRALLAKGWEMILRSVPEGFPEPLNVMVVLVPPAGSV
jgi:hypothetical protein